MTDQEKLEDVIINLFSGKYTKKEIIATLTWGEHNTKIYYPLMQKHQPNYYCDVWENPIQSFTLIKDLALADKT